MPLVALNSIGFLASLVLVESPAVLSFNVLWVSSRSVNVVKHIFNTILLLPKIPHHELAQDRTQLICHILIESPAVYLSSA